MQGREGTVTCWEHHCHMADCFELHNPTSTGTRAKTAKQQERNIKRLHRTLQRKRMKGK